MARGARAAESLVVAELAHLADAARRDPSLLARPVRVVVPSRSLREHLAAQLVRARGASLVGVSVQTLRGVAAEILQNRGEPTPGGEPLLPAAVRRAAAREPVLCRALDGLEDGFASLVGAIDDLLDAGFEPALASALDDCLAETAAGDGAARARALVRVACAVLEHFAAEGIEHRASLFRRARDAIELDPNSLPCRALLVHGYADATGVQLDLVEALLRALPGRLVLDRPPAPAGKGPAPGVGFTERLATRLGFLGLAEEAAAGTTPVKVEIFRAAGAQAEARAVAERVHALLAAGVPAERVGVVARDLAAHLVPLRVQLRRLGVPFSGAPGATGPLGPVARRVRALLELLERRGRLAADRWLEAFASLASLGRGSARRARIADLRVAVHALGAARLEDLARLEPEAVLRGRAALELPVRRGIDEDAGDDRREPPVLSARPRTLRAELLREVVARARESLEALGRWPERAPLAFHWHSLESLLDALAWAGDSDERAGVLAPKQTLPSSFEAAREEFVALLVRRLRRFGAVCVGGEGGGVSVLSVMEARARTFEHLFLVGVNRDAFPRVVAEDPLFPDSLRRAATAVLPDLPVKERGRDEERYLFAQLLSSAPAVTLSWLAVTDDGKERTPSPLLEHLRAVVDPDAAPLAPTTTAVPVADAPARPALERALLAGLHARRRGRAFADALTVALDGAEAVAAARLAALDELDPGRERSRQAGPWLGFVGAGSVPAHGFAVTRLEQLARCPWQTFLERVLRVEAVPDALAALPDVDARLLGQVVHAVLERIVRDALGEHPVELARLDPAGVRDAPWPESPRLEQILLDEAEHVLEQEHVAWPGFARLLAARAAPLLEHARRLEAPEGRIVGVVGAEVSDTCRVGEQLVRFRADRADFVNDQLVLVDYKTGAPPSSSPVAETRRRKLVDEIAQGRFLQAPVYARAAENGAGRFVFLADPESPAAGLAVESGEVEAQRALEGCVAAVADAFATGSFFPRLVDAKGREPHACSWCRVAEACLRGDSGVRRRLRRLGEAEESATPAEAALRALWRRRGDP